MISLVLFIAVIIATIFFLANSYATRRSEGVKRKQYQAKTNISMGVLFVTIGAFQLLLPVQHWFRALLITFIFAVGLINLFYGIRNWRKFRTAAEEK
ncbi:MAG: YtpI family protein [Planifilum fulgidum]